MSRVSLDDGFDRISAAHGRPFKLALCVCDLSGGTIIWCCLDAAAETAAGSGEHRARPPVGYCPIVIVNSWLCFLAAERNHELRLKEQSLPAKRLINF